MDKLKQAINKLFVFLKKKLILVSLVVFAVIFGAFAYNDYINNEIDKLENKKSAYVIKQADDLFTIKGDKLNNVVNFIVVSPHSGTSKDIVIKEKDAKKIVIYKDVSREAFYIYSQSILEPYLKEDKRIDFRYLNDFNGIHKRLGVKEDPKNIKAPKDENPNSPFLNTLFNMLLLGLLLWGFLILSGRVTANSVDIVMPQDIKDDLDDLVGLEDIKSELLQLEDMYKNEKMYRKYNVPKIFNVMMTGGAGLGKTKISRCLAKRLDIPMVYMSAASLQSGYVGGGAKTLRQLAKKASAHKRSIVFIDEAESLLQSRMNTNMKDWERETINAFLAILDGVNTHKSEIIWIVASNMDEHKIAMDEAMLRRFHLKVNFRAPSFEERKKLIECLIGKINSQTIEQDIDVTKLAGVSSGMSPALLETMVSRASLIAAKDQVKVSQDILMKAFERVAVGLTDRETTGDMDEKRLLVARHEAGHFILKVHEALLKSSGNLAEIKDHIDVIKISTEAVSKMGALGFVLSKEKDVKLESLKDYEMQIMQLYGGMANEEIYYGTAGVTAGAHNDIEKISHLLRVMICEVGFYQKPKLNYSVISQKPDINTNQLALIERTSERLYAETVALLNEHRELTDILVGSLMSDYILNIDDALLHVERYFVEKGGTGSVYGGHPNIKLTA